MASFYTAKLALSDAAEHAVICHYTEGPAQEYHAKVMRDNIVMALSGCEAGVSVGACRADLSDLIETAIIDSHDLDSTDRDAAESVLRALLDNVAPMPAKKERAA